MADGMTREQLCRLPLVREFDALNCDDCGEFFTMQAMSQPMFCPFCGEQLLYPGRPRAPITEIFNYYREKMGKHPKLYTLSIKRRKMGEKRWHECLAKTKGDFEKARFLMEAAIDALARSDFHNARGKYAGSDLYNDWEIIFRSTEQFEKFLERSNG